MQHFTRWLIIALVLLGLGGIGYLWWQKQQGPALVPLTEAPPLASQTPMAQAPEPVASAPANYPIEAIAPLEGASAPTQPLPLVAEDDHAVREAVTELLGRDQVLSFLDMTDFARRVVATVDNLGREHAASRLWPVAPAPARFLVVERDGVEYIAGGNGDRYNAFVRFATAIDSGAAVALYVRMYPVLQKAYEDLGYPGKYLNNRVVEVIDLLLQTPEPEAPIQLSLIRVKGPIAEKRPWLRYEYADPDLQSRSSGQKILLRMGLRNTAALKAKLRDLRKRIAGSAVGR
jgi:hypothetical protein